MGFRHRSARNLAAGAGPVKGGSEKGLNLPATDGQPVVQLSNAVATPEHFLVGDECRRSPDALCDGPICSSGGSAFAQMSCAIQRRIGKHDLAMRLKGA